MGRNAGSSKRWIWPAVSAAACGLLVAAMVLSAWRGPYWRGPSGWYLGLRCGRAVIGRNFIMDVRGFGWGPEREPMRWWFEQKPRSDAVASAGPSTTPAMSATGSRAYVYYYVPLWIPALALALTPALAAYRRGRGLLWRRRGRCEACGYEVGGAARCPECGTGARRQCE